MEVGTERLGVFFLGPPYPPKIHFRILRAFLHGFLIAVTQLVVGHQLSQDSIFLLVRKSIVPIELIESFGHCFSSANQLNQLSELREFS